MLDNKTAHSEKLEEGLARTASVVLVIYWPKTSPKEDTKAKKF